MILVLPMLVLLVGLFLFMLGTGKASRIGEIMLFTALFVILLRAPEALGIIR